MSEAAGFPPDGSDGSMETILASIRRIIREDEAAVAPPEELLAVDDDEDDLLVLDQSMMVQPTIEEAAMTIDAVHAANADALSAADLAAALFDDPPPAPIPAPPAVIVAALPVVPEAVLPRPTHSLVGADETLLAPQTRLAASQSIAALQEAVRPVPDAGLRLLRSGGPTLEDMVRDELRLQVKDWLDANLPELVERLVRQEIEQLVRPA